MHEEFPLKLRLVSHEEPDHHRLARFAKLAVEYNVPDDQVVTEIFDCLAPYPLESMELTETDILQAIRSAESTYRRGAAVFVKNWFLGSNKFTGKPAKEPLSLASVIEQTNNAAPGLFRVDNVLAVDDPHHGLHVFDRHGSAGLTGFLRNNANVDFAKGGGYVSANELFAELSRTAPRYDGIELIPHEPRIEGIYYRGKPPEPGDGTHLRWLVNRFNPETTIDRDLIQAAFMTAFWGGPPGRRPAFAITSDDGRGVGKTTLAEIIGYLCGGVIDVSANEDIASIKQRMLSPQGQTKRIALLDNVKSMKFSWPELEALITTPVISGKRMYVGEGQRPNTLCWFVTLNGPSMATDMAQRSVVIKLVRYEAESAGSWYEDTINYIDKHRTAIIGDIIAALRADPLPLQKCSRWATWEEHVLSRLPEPAETQRLILERQTEANCELDEAAIIEQEFSLQLAARGFEPEIAQVRIPVGTAAEWLSTALGDRVKTTAASRRLKQMAKEGQLRRIAHDPSRSHGRNFIWTGENANYRTQTIDNSLIQQQSTMR